MLAFEKNLNNWIIKAKVQEKLLMLISCPLQLMI